MQTRTLVIKLLADLTVLGHQKLCEHCDDTNDTLKFLQKDKTTNVSRAIVFDWYGDFWECEEVTPDHKQTSHPTENLLITGQIIDIVSNHRQTMVTMVLKKG